MLFGNVKNAIAILCKMRYNVITNLNEGVLRYAKA